MTPQTGAKTRRGMRCAHSAAAHGTIPTATCAVLSEAARNQELPTARMGSALYCPAAERPEGAARLGTRGGATNLPLEVVKRSGEERQAPTLLASGACAPIWPHLVALSDSGLLRLEDDFHAVFLLVAEDLVAVAAPDPAARRWVMMKLGSISPFSMRSSSGRMYRCTCVCPVLIVSASVHDGAHRDLVDEAAVDARRPRRCRPCGRPGSPAAARSAGPSPCARPAWLRS